MRIKLWRLALLGLFTLGSLVTIKPTHADPIEINISVFEANFCGSNLIDNSDFEESENNHSSLSQVLHLEPGNYLLTFFYHPHTSPPRDNTLEVFLEDLETLTSASGILTTGEIKDEDSDWEELSAKITVKSDGDHRLTFSASGTEKTLEDFLDNISLRKECETPLTGGDGDEGSGMTCSLQSAELAEDLGAWLLILLLIGIPLGLHRKTNSRS